MRLLQADGGKSITNLSLNPGSEKPPGKIVGKLTRRIMLRHQLPEPGKVFPVQSFQIPTVNIFAVLSQVGARPDIFNQLFGSSVVILEAVRIIANQIDPGGTAFASGSDQGPVMTARREANFENRVGQPGGVHFFIQLDEAPGHLEGVFKGHGKLQFLVQVVYGTIIGFAAFQHEVGSFFETMRQRRHRRQKTGVGNKIAKPGCHQRVDGDGHKLPHRPRTFR